MSSFGNWLLVANYMSGTVCVYPVYSDEQIGALADKIQHSGGAGVVSDRQESAHPHSVFPIPQTPYWLVPDLGNDTIYTYHLDQQNGKLNLRHRTKAPSGSGPRQPAGFDKAGTFHKVINNWTFYLSKLFPMNQYHDVQPSTFSGLGSCLIHPGHLHHGRFLYVHRRIFRDVREMPF